MPLVLPLQRKVGPALTNALGLAATASIVPSTSSGDELASHPTIAKAVEAVRSTWQSGVLLVDQPGVKGFLHIIPESRAVGGLLHIEKGGETVPAAVLGALDKDNKMSRLSLLTHDAVGMSQLPASLGFGSAKPQDVRQAKRKVEEAGDAVEDAVEEIVDDLVEEVDHANLGRADNAAELVERLRKMGGAMKREMMEEKRLVDEAREEIGEAREEVAEVADAAVNGPKSYRGLAQDARQAERKISEAMDEMEDAVEEIMDDLMEEVDHADLDDADSVKELVERVGEMKKEMTEEIVEGARLVEEAREEIREAREEMSDVTNVIGVPVEFDGLSQDVRQAKRKVREAQDAVEDAIEEIVDDLKEEIDHADLDDADNVKELRDKIVEMREEIREELVEEYRLIEEAQEEIREAQEEVQEVTGTPVAVTDIIPPELIERADQTKKAIDIVLNADINSTKPVVAIEVCPKSGTLSFADGTSPVIQKIIASHLVANGTPTKENFVVRLANRGLQPAVVKLAAEASDVDVQKFVADEGVTVEASALGAGGRVISVKVPQAVEFLQRSA